MRIALLVLTLVFALGTFDADAKKRRSAKKHKPVYTQTKKAEPVKQAETPAATPAPAVQAPTSSTSDMIKGAVVGAAAGAVTGAVVNELMGSDDEEKKEETAEAKDAKPEEKAEVKEESKEEVAEEPLVKEEDNSIAMILMLALAGLIAGLMFIKARK